MSNLRNALGIVPKNIEKHEFLLNEGFKIMYEGRWEYEFHGVVKDNHFRILIYETSIDIIYSIKYESQPIQTFKYTDKTWDETYKRVIEFVSIFKILG